MPVDVWFPLAIYYADLPGAAEHKERLQSAIQASHKASPRRHHPDAAWTGDIHSVATAHLDPAFEWLTEQVEHHAAQYLLALGHDPSLVDLYIQRAWPVVSEPGQAITMHWHPTAHISAAYYVSVPSTGSAGRIRFLNQHRPNELSPQASTANTKIYAAWNHLNYHSAAYQPMEGRLLLFPAKQQHDVEKNDSDGTRISLSYDMVLVAREDADPGSHEYVTPPLRQWRLCKRPVGVGE